MLGCGCGDGERSIWCSTVCESECVCDCGDGSEEAAMGSAFSWSESGECIAWIGVRSASRLVERDRDSDSGASGWARCIGTPAAPVTPAARVAYMSEKFCAAPVTRGERGGIAAAGEG